MLSPTGSPSACNRTIGSAAASPRTGRPHGHRLSSRIVALSNLAGRIADVGGRRLGQDGGKTGSAHYSEIGPYAQGMVDVGDGQLIHWAVCGNPDGKPAVVVHGGPGSGGVYRNSPKSRQPVR